LKLWRSVLLIFGRNLKTLREKKGLEQTDLANALGVSRETVSYYENRATNPTAELVNKIADFKTKEI
jgi:repressor LexA